MISETAEFGKLIKSKKKRTLYAFLLISECYSRMKIRIIHKLSRIMYHCILYYYISMIIRLLIKNLYLYILHFECSKCMETRFIFLDVGDN